MAGGICSSLKDRPRCTCWHLRNGPGHALDLHFFRGERFWASGIVIDGNPSFSCRIAPVIFLDW